MAFAPTTQQLAILTATTETPDHLAIVARAGCGKTSTIELAVGAIARKWPKAEQLVCAFNKSIADEVGQKLKKAGHTDWRTVQASTLHSMGFGLLKRAFNPQIDDKKVSKIVDHLAAHDEDQTFAQQSQNIIKLVGFAKQAGVGFFPDLPIDSQDVWAQLCDHYDVNSFDDTSILDDVINAARRVYRMSNNDTSTIDFDDMILFPLIKNLRVRFGKDFIFLDEAQDLSRTRQALARKFLKFGVGRMIVVGDDRQAIYGFTGADAGALNNLISSLRAKVLPLTVTWRCPKSVVALAQGIVPDIVAADTAPDGTVASITAEQFEKTQLLATDAILCRNTKPLVQMAYGLIRRGVACKVEGRAIGDGLVALAKRWKVTTTAALLKKLEDYQDREVQKAMAKDQEQKAEQVIDKCETMRVIIGAANAQGKTSVSDVVAMIQSMFSDDVKDVLTLATYHRSKGREWERVFLLSHSELCPARSARQEWQMEQEHNLAYVAYTRAKKELYFVA